MHSFGAQGLEADKFARLQSESFSLLKAVRLRMVLLETGTWVYYHVARMLVVLVGVVKVANGTLTVGQVSEAAGTVVWLGNSEAYCFQNGPGEVCPATKIPAALTPDFLILGCAKGVKAKRGEGGE